MLRRTRSVIYRTDYHLVFNTKYRKGVLQGAIAKRTKEILETITTKRQWKIRELRIMPDHIHLLISIPPQEKIPDVVKQLKGTSSRYLFQEFPGLRTKLRKGHLWAPSYFVRAAGSVTMGTVKRYIREQEL
jgi:putative transposase